MDLTVGLAIQCIGIFLVTVLSFFMVRSVGSISSKYWTIAWTCLSISLVSLFCATRIDGEAQRLLYSLYFLGQFGFGLMLIAGCRNHARCVRLERKNLSRLVLLGILVALLPYLFHDFNSLVIVQSAMMTALFATALYSLRSIRGNSSPGESLMSAGLLLLSLSFLQYVLVFGAREMAWDFHMPDYYVRYTAIGDLILEILLGFGTVVVMMEGVRREVEAVNRKLTATRDRLEQIARMDPLTEALTRHAFESLSSDSKKGQAGCVAVFDLDNLKPINDTHGHAAGDSAIRAVAKAIRTVTRPDDLLFRWGGDEFLVLMFGMSETLARGRLDFLNSLLEDMILPSADSPVTVSVSHGISSFDSMADLPAAIERADERMYKSKFMRKQKVTQPVLFAD